MSKSNQKPARAAAANSVDWTAEAAKIEAASKEKAGSRGDALQRAGKATLQDTAAGALLREACGEAGAQRLIEQPRNVLAKLPRLAQCIVSGQPWCSASALLPENRRKEDASVVVALAGLGGGNARQKENVAAALARYPGGANAQMPAALEALAFIGIVERKPGSKRNAEYAIADQRRADALMPQ